MALRNAFDGMATETTLRRLYNSLNYARDAFDRLRVIPEGGYISDSGIVAMMWGNRDTYPTWYGRGAPTSMDAREQQRAQMKSNFNNVRMNRWTIT